MGEDERALRYARQAGRLLRLPTVYVRDAPLPETFGELHRLLEELFPRLHAAAEVRDFAGSLLFKLGGTDPAGGLPLALMSHHDVVAATGDWRYGPFSGEIAEGRLWGRGALDVKVNLFCMLQAVEELLAAGVRPLRDLYLISSCMEEVGGNDLVADWLAARGVELGLLLDEGSPVMADPFPGAPGDWAAIAVAEKGSANVRFTARGAGGHAMMLHRDSPLVRLGRLMVSCEEQPPFPLAPDAAVAAMLEAVGARPDDAAGLEGLLGPLEAGMAGTTMVFTCAQGSSAPNVVPTEASVTANLRLAPPLTPQGALEVLAERAAAFGVEAELVDGRPPSPAADPGGPGFAQVAAAVRAALPGAEPIPYVLAGGTDTKHFHKVCRCCLRFTPLRVDRAQQFAVHGVDENVDVAALPGGVDFFKALVAGWT